MCVINWNENLKRRRERGRGDIFCVSVGSSLRTRNVPPRRLAPSHRSGLDQGVHTSQNKTGKMKHLKNKVPHALTVVA